MNYATITLRSRRIDQPICSHLRHNTEKQINDAFLIIDLYKVSLSKRRKCFSASNIGASICRDINCANKPKQERTNLIRGICFDECLINLVFASTHISSSLIMIMCTQLRRKIKGGLVERKWIM